MLTSERREKIKEYITEYRTASVGDLAAIYNVSTETIRRDFAELEKQGLIRRSYGGAILNDRMTSFINSKARTGIIRSKKQQIVSRITSHIHPHDCIFIDHSTTAATLCELIKELPLTVVTNSLLVINAFTDSPNIKLNCTGGIYEDFHKAFLGASTLDYIRRHKLDKAFISCRTINRNGGLYDSSEAESELRKCVIENARTTFLMVDNTKIDRYSFVHTAPLTNINFLVTNNELPPEWHDLSNEFGFTIIDHDEHAKEQG